MKLRFDEFARLESPAEVVIHSLAEALYQVTVSVDGEERLLAENDGSAFRCYSVQQAREALQLMPVASLRLRQRSAYDEMVGQPLREQDNTLEVPLALEQ